MGAFDTSQWSYTLKLRSYYVNVPEWLTFAQHWLATYYVARNTIQNVVSQFTCQRIHHIAGAIVERMCSASSGTLLSCVNSHHRQHSFTLVGDDLGSGID